MFHFILVIVALLFLVTVSVGEFILAILYKLGKLKKDSDNV